jgi:hypothetical protein
MVYSFHYLRRYILIRTFLCLSSAEKNTSTFERLHALRRRYVSQKARVGAVALYTVLWSVVAKYMKWPFSTPRRTKTAQPINVKETLRRSRIVELSIGDVRFAPRHHQAAKTTSGFTALLSRMIKNCIVVTQVTTLKWQKNSK